MRVLRDTNSATKAVHIERVLNHLISAEENEVSKRQGMTGQNRYIDWPLRSELANIKESRRRKKRINTDKLIKILYNFDPSKGKGD